MNKWDIKNEITVNNANVKSHLFMNVEPTTLSCAFSNVVKVVSSSAKTEVKGNSWSMGVFFDPRSLIDTAIRDKASGATQKGFII